ncbi:MAG: hypothetical protein ABIJ26_02645 [Candidatus Margulisiibacteriota bacterium]|nr:hypothetical protein [Candidatus Margulisiibacteriota bacterium]
MRKYAIILLVLFFLDLGTCLADQLISPEPNVVTIEAGIKRVVVVPADYDFSAEAEEFTEFRRRYVTLWSIFFLSAFIIPYAW